MGEIDPQEKKEIPIDVEYLYRVFSEMKFTRIPKDGVTLLSPKESITILDIESYGRISGLNFEPWESNALLSMDGVFNHFYGG